MPRVTRSQKAAQEASKSLSSVQSPIVASRHPFNDLNSNIGSVPDHQSPRTRSSRKKVQVNQTFCQSSKQSDEENIIPERESKKKTRRTRQKVLVEIEFDDGSSSGASSPPAYVAIPTKHTQRSKEAKTKVSAQPQVSGIPTPVRRSARIVDDRQTNKTEVVEPTKTPSRLPIPRNQTTIEKPKELNETPSRIPNFSSIPTPTRKINFGKAVTKKSESDETIVSSANIRAASLQNSDTLQKSFKDIEPAKSNELVGGEIITTVCATPVAGKYLSKLPTPKAKTPATIQNNARNTIQPSRITPMFPRTSSKSDDLATPIKPKASVAITPKTVEIGLKNRSQSQTVTELKRGKTTANKSIALSNSHGEQALPVIVSETSVVATETIKAEKPAVKHKKAPVVAATRTVMLRAQASKGKLVPNSSQTAKNDPADRIENAAVQETQMVGSIPERANPPVTMSEEIILNQVKPLKKGSALEKPEVEAIATKNAVTPARIRDQKPVQTHNANSKSSRKVEIQASPKKPVVKTTISSVKEQLHTKRTGTTFDGLKTNPTMKVITSLSPVKTLKSVKQPTVPVAFKLASEAITSKNKALREERQRRHQLEDAKKLMTGTTVKKAAPRVQPSVARAGNVLNSGTANTSLVKERIKKLESTRQLPVKSNRNLIHNPSSARGQTSATTLQLKTGRNQTHMLKVNNTDEVVYASLPSIEIIEKQSVETNIKASTVSSISTSSIDEVEALRRAKIRAEASVRGHQAALEWAKKQQNYTAA